MTMTNTNYLALYIGPCGPISAFVTADSLAAAKRVIAERGHDWYDTGSDVLGLDPDSDGLDGEIELALEGWTLVSKAPTDADYDLYVPACGSTEDDYRTLCKESGTEPVEYEQQVLSAVERRSMPPAARDVLDGLPANQAYWAWLCTQVALDDAA